MSYQISYGQDVIVRKKRGEYRPIKISKEGFVRLVAMAAVLLILSACLVPQFRMWVRDALIPGDPDVTAAAATRLVEAVSDGEAIQTALTEFCREIIDHGLQAV